MLITPPQENESENSTPPTVWELFSVWDLTPPLPRRIWHYLEDAQILQPSLFPSRCIHARPALFWGTLHTVLKAVHSSFTNNTGVTDYYLPPHCLCSNPCCFLLFCSSLCKSMLVLISLNWFHNPLTGHKPHCERSTVLEGHMNQIREMWTSQNWLTFCYSKFPTLDTENKTN